MGGLETGWCQVFTWRDRVCTYTNVVCITPLYNALEYVPLECLGLLLVCVCVCVCEGGTEWQYVCTNICLCAYMHVHIPTHIHTHTYYNVWIQCVHVDARIQMQARVLFFMRETLGFHVQILMCSKHADVEGSQVHIFVFAKYHVILDRQKVRDTRHKLSKHILLSLTPHICKCEHSHTWLQK
jgi:hypothetical protein